jgi:autotransporter-associated beta strand protein
MPLACPFTTRLAARAICITYWLFIASSLFAQTLTVADDTKTVPSLTPGTVATLTGRSELHVTGTGDPIASATINLNSVDAWFFLDNIRPASVTSTFLPRIKVSGASAVSGTNVRVVEYGMGTVVIPHPPSFQPLQVYSGPCFTGNSVNLSLNTYYNSAASLGTMNRNISSFKLKRGYSATFAQNANGTGTSRVFVAQDGDIQISVMPLGLQNSAAFVRVIPWCWIGKKGWAGAVQNLVDPLWSYDWDNVTSSTANTEYVPMRHNSTWNAYSNINSKQNSTHALGFNEPDKTDQANMTVEAALAQWPNLLASGLRLGAPAPSDAGAGLTWLYSFIDAAKVANLRVDYVPVHFYKGNWTASQLYNWLKAIHDRTGLPIWVTEFNNGANWTDSTELPTLASNATEINGFLDVMNSAPFVERYSIYNWVGATRMMVDDAGALTPAGIVYRDKASPIAYVQSLPPAVGRGIAQFPLDGDTIDNSGYGNNSLAVGIPSYVTGHRGQAIQLDGGNYLQLPGSVVNSTAFSFSAWVLWNGGSDNQRIFDFGNDTTQFIYLCPGAGGKMRLGLRNGSAATIAIETAALSSGAWHHVAVTMAGTTAKIYLDGVLQVSGSITTPTISATDYNYIGKSQWPADPLFNGLLDDVRLADYALSAAQIAALVSDTPPQFSTTTLTSSAATQGQPYAGSITGSATDTNAGDTISYAKASGPDWLQVSTTGVLSGTPTFTDEGAQEFTISAYDSAGATHFTVLTIQLPTVLGNGTWTSDSTANWSDTTKWYGAFPANGAGYTASFNTINITADRTVTLNGSRSIGTLSFGDISGTQNWRLDSSSGAVLTLDTGTTTSPSIVVNQNTVTLATPLAGVNGFTKSGSGTLALAAANSLSGTVYIDTNSTTTAEGIVRATHPDALDLVTTIQIRDNNAGSSTLELDGTLGGIITTAALTLSGRNNSVLALRNIAGDNSITGGLTLNSGGSNYYLQSDAGTLTLGGSLTSLATGSRILTFSGTGNRRRRKSFRPDELHFRTTCAYF